MDWGSIFHREWARLANALNKLMNEIINEQSLKWGDPQGERSACAVEEVKESFLEEAE